MSLAYESSHLVWGKKIKFFLTMFTMFIKSYIIMKYEKTKHQCRTSKTNQQSDESAQKFSIGAEDDEVLDRRIWDIKTAGVSLCARGEKTIGDVTIAREERSIDCEIAREHNQASSEIEDQDKKNYQLDYNRIVEALSKTKWNVKKVINGQLNLKGLSYAIAFI